MNEISIFYDYVEYENGLYFWSLNDACLCRMDLSTGKKDILYATCDGMCEQHYQICICNNRIILAPNIGDYILMYDLIGNNLKKIPHGVSMTESNIVDRNELFRYCVSKENFVMIWGFVLPIIIRLNVATEEIKIHRLFEGTSLSLKERAFNLGEGELIDGYIYIPHRKNNSIFKVDVDNFVIEEIFIPDLPDDMESSHLWTDKTGCLLFLSRTTNHIFKVNKNMEYEIINCVKNGICHSPVKKIDNKAYFYMENDGKMRCYDSKLGVEEIKDTKVMVTDFEKTAIRVSLYRDMYITYIKNLPQHVASMSEIMREDIYSLNEFLRDV